MKKYIFASFYLAAMKVGAVLIMIYGFVQGFPDFLAIQRATREISDIHRQQLHEVNIPAVSQQLEHIRQSLIRDPQTSTRILTKIQQIPGREQLTWRGAHLRTARESLRQSKAVLGEIKEGSLKEFMEQIDPLIEGSRNRIAQLSPTNVAGEPRQPQTPGSLSVDSSIFDPQRSNILSFYDNVLPAIRSFLTDDLQNYTPTPAALEMGDRAIVALRIFDRHIEILRTMRAPSPRPAGVTPQRQINRRDRDEIQTAREFHDTLIAIRGGVLENFTENWSLDRVIQSMSSVTETNLAKIESAQEIRFTAIFSMIQEVFIGLLGALLLLILRDFLSAAIHTAQNTAQISTQLSGVSVEID